MATQRTASTQTSNASTSRGSARCTMLASSCPMNAPAQVPATIEP